jgi:hypothetical protein
MNTEITTFNYKDQSFEHKLNILTNNTKDGMSIDIKMGNIDDKKDQKIRLSRIVRVVMCNKILPQHIVKKNINNAVNNIDAAKFKMSIPDSNFVIRVYINNKIISYTASIQIMDSPDIPYSIGFSFGLRNREMTVFDCTDYKPFVYSLQSELALELQQRMKKYNITSVGLNTKTGMCHINMKNPKPIQKKTISFMKRDEEFPSLR